MLRIRSSKEVVVISCIVIALLLVVSSLFKPSLFEQLFAFTLGNILGDEAPSIRLASVTSRADDRSVICFDQKKMSYSRHPFLFTDFVELTSESGEKGRIVWQLKENDSHVYKPVLSITYGICPDGFQEMMPAGPLSIGKFYRINQSSELVKKTAVCRYELVKFADHRRE